MKKSVFLCTFLGFSLILTAYTQTSDPQLLRQHVYTLASDSMRGRSAGSQEGLLSAIYIAQYFKEIGLISYEQDSYFQYFLINQNIKCQNVIGIIEGKDSLLKQEYIIIGAHYDHIGYRIKENAIEVYNGADDNASGIAALIELARLLKANEHQLKRSVMLVAFDAEERGLLGSKFLVSQLPLQHIKLMVSMDMVGYYKKSNKLFIKGVATLKDGKTNIQDIAFTAPLNLRMQNFEKTLFAATDTRYFAMENIPAFHITTGMLSPYHKPQDDADEIDYEGLSIITDFMHSFTLRMSQNESLSYSHRRNAIHPKDKVVAFGLLSAFGMSHLRYTQGAFAKGRSGWAYKGGLLLQIRINSYLSIRPECSYTYENFYQPSTSSYTSHIEKLHLQSLHFPLSLLLRTTFDESIYAYVGLGGYYSYVFSAKIRNQKLSLVQDIYPHRYGLQYSLGLHIAPVNIESIFRFDLYPLFHHDKSIKNNAFFLQLAYVF